MDGLPRRVSKPIETIIRRYLPNFGAVVLGGATVLRIESSAKEPIYDFINQQGEIKLISFLVRSPTDVQRNLLAKLISEGSEFIERIEIDPIVLNKSCKEDVRKFIKEKIAEIRLFVRIMYTMSILAWVTIPTILYYLGNGDPKLYLSFVGGLIVIVTGLSALHVKFISERRGLETVDLLLTMDGVDAVRLLEKLIGE